MAQEVIKKTGKCPLLIQGARDVSVSDRISSRRYLDRRYTPIEQWVHHVCCSDVDATAFLTLSSHNHGRVQHNYPSAKEPVLLETFHFH